MDAYVVGCVARAQPVEIHEPVCLAQAFGVAVVASPVIMSRLLQCMLHAHGLHFKSHNMEGMLHGIQKVLARSMYIHGAIVMVGDSKTEVVVHKVLRLGCILQHSIGKRAHSC